MRYFSKNSITGSLEYNTLLGRQNLDEDTFNARIRWQFCRAFTQRRIQPGSIPKIGWPSLVPCIDGKKSLAELQ